MRRDIWLSFAIHVIVLAGNGSAVCHGLLSWNDGIQRDDFPCVQHSFPSDGGSLWFLPRAGPHVLVIPSSLPLDVDGAASQGSINSSSFPV